MTTVHKFLLLALALFVVLAIVPDANAASLDTKTMLDNPQTTSGVATGLSEVLRFVFLFLKFLAVIAAGYGSYLMWKGEISSGVWSYVAALALFFSPALVDLAQSIGKGAATTNAVGSPSGGT
jgi:hypothetical protein